MNEETKLEGVEASVKEESIEVGKNIPEDKKAGRKPPKTTRRKVKVVGTQTFINQSTGELQDMQVVSIAERDANFHKIWLEHIIQSLDIIGNQKMRFAFWLLDNMNSENQITMTLRQMTQKSGMSLQTVSRTIRALMESDFLRRVNQGVYQVNPDVIFKGGMSNRMNVLLEYQNVSSEELPQKN